MRTVASKSKYRLSQIAINAKGTNDEGRVRRRLTLLAKRDQQAVESAIRLTTETERAADPAIKTTSERLQAEIMATLQDVSGLLSEEAAQEFPAGNVVP